MKGLLFCILPFFLWTYCSSQNDRGRRCGHVPVIENGDIRELPLRNYASGSTVTYKCQQYYIMRGPSVVRCINGNWTETPVCIEPCTIAEVNMTHNKILLKWKDDKKLYARSGEVVEFACKFGYQPDPSSPPFRQHCVEGQLEYPKCVLKSINDCLAVEEHMNPNNIQLKWTDAQAIHVRSGEVVEFVCKVGYQPDPSSPPFRPRCVEGKLAYPRCVLNSVNDCPATEVDMKPKNIEFKWTTTQEINVRAGQFVEFICKAGYQPDPVSLPFRQRCVEGNLEYPRCM